jgi:hypothetical protein
MVVVIKKERNQLHDAVETAAGLNTTCQCAKKDAEISSESAVSTTYIGFLFDGNEIEEL